MQISPYIKGAYSANKGSNRPHKLDLSNVFIYAADLDGVDFSGVDITNTVFETSNFNGAILRPEKYQGAQFIASAWWQASEIDQDLLNYLMMWWYPYDYGQGEYYYGGEHFTRDYYVSRINKLCKPMREECREDRLKFGSPAPAPANERKD